ncbi:transaldolase family protein [Traorella massiliensis]|uniref:transaldolase family protein n=1 Tax=Traorella massiliensis TaxID=1903263 RepID=UPI002357D828|nr:transaldolase family protein [Traorella massiliensis]
MKKLLETVTKFPQTQVWNDSCSCNELSYAIENGAVGATTNPVIVLNVLKKELKEWEPTIEKIIADNPTFSEDEVAWEVIKSMGAKASKLLYPIFKETNGQKGRISFQTNAKFYNNAAKMVEHACDLAATVENSQVKAPASKAGIEAYEEMTYRGVSINATVSFTVSQAIAVAEAVERGLKRREAEGLPTDTMHPVCTIMAGRVDDYLKNDIKAKGMLVEPEILEWAGVAVVKHAYQIYQERGYRTQLLVAAYRNPYHWLSFVGGDIVLTIPYAWQLKYNESNYEIKDYMSQPVNPDYLSKLMKLEEFRKAYDENGLKPEDFEHYGAFKATITSFLGGYDDLCKLIRGYMVK